MSETHLADQQIQAYLDDPEELSPIARNHLTNCAACLQSLENYRTLWATVEAVDLPTLSPGFAERVMLRLPIEHQFVRVARKSRPLVGVLAVGGAMLASAALLTVSYFVPGLIGQLAAFWVTMYQSVSSSFRDSMQPVFTDLHIRPSIILCSIIALAGAASIDRIVIRYRHWRTTHH